MEATIRINTDEMNSDFLENIKRMFPHHEVELNLQPMDETAFVMARPAYAEELLNRIKSVEAGEPLITVNPEDLLK